MSLLNYFEFIKYIKSDSFTLGFPKPQKQCIETGVLFTYLNGTDKDFAVFNRRVLVTLYLVTVCDYNVFQVSTRFEGLTSLYDHSIIPWEYLC